MPRVSVVIPAKNEARNIAWVLQRMPAYVDEVIVDGPLVSTRGYLTGSHQGEFMGVQPSGEQILVKYIDQWRFEDGQAQESWVSLDLLGLMQQIGAIGS